MNKILAETIGMLNAVIAGFLLIAGGIAVIAAAMNNGGILALIFGFAAVIVFTVLICGFIALLVSIRQELQAIRALLAGQRG